MMSQDSLQATLNALLDAAISGESVLNQWLAENTIEEPKVVASFADQVATSMYKGRIPRQGMFCSRIASAVWLVIGDAAKASVSKTNELEAAFSMADSEELYEEVRTKCREAATRARDSRQLGSAFDQTVLAADCAYWAAECASPEGKSRWWKACLDDLVVAEALGAPAGVSRMSRYASLAVAAFRQARKLPEPEVAPTFVRLAYGTERLVPPDYTYPNNPKKSLDTARWLTELSNEYGDPRVAAHRAAFMARGSR